MEYLKWMSVQKAIAIMEQALVKLEEVKATIIDKTYEDSRDEMESKSVNIYEFENLFDFNDQSLTGTISNRKGKPHLHKGFEVWDYENGWQLLNSKTEVQIKTELDTLKSKLLIIDTESDSELEEAVL